MRSTTSLMLLASLACLTLHATSPSAQVVSNPNFIQGQFLIETAMPPSWFDELERLSLMIETNSLPPAPESSATASTSADTGSGLDYEIAVESSAEGIAHSLSFIATLSHESGHSRIYSSAIETPPVQEPPAAAVAMDLSTCVGRVIVNYVDEHGSPFVVNSVSHSSDRGDGVTRSGHTQTIAFLPAGPIPEPTSLLLTISSDGAFEYTTIEVTPTCDGTSFHQVIVHSEPPYETGSIIGRIALNGMTHETGSSSWVVSADQQDDVDEDGNYELHGVPAGPAYARGQLVFGAGVDYQTLRFPGHYFDLGADRTVDLADRFVLDPSWIRGDIELHGPPGVEHEELLRLLALASPSGDRPPGLLSRVSVDAEGDHNGSGQSFLTGTFVPGATVFLGEQETLLYAKEGRTYAWSWPEYDLRLDRESSGGSRLDCRFGIDPRGTFTNSVGETVEHDIEVCLSTITLTYQSEGLNLYRPELSGFGSFTGIDGRGMEQDYLVSGVRLQGDPRGQINAAPEGSILMMLPQGQYQLTPTLRQVHPSGTTTRATLATLELDIGCQQDLFGYDDLLVEVELDVASRASERPALTASVIGSAEVAEMSYRTAEGPATLLCTDCGMTPSHSFEVPATSEVVVTAVDVAGRLARTTQHVVFEGPPEPSALDRGGDVPLLVTPETAATLRLTFEETGADSYAAHVGSLAALRAGTYDHAPVTCTLAEPSLLLDTPVGDAYFLIRARVDDVDSSLGRDSAGRERPDGSEACP